ncbi:O-Glycosyl hydrolases family 17 protein [Striga asiatica]|uniref:O-Glycosyl hydrolases family 17 protein n=1 Tax=Striga asiatica TaxID=4170 RepID=A0A5A7QZK3_STRAF|nr:O-Glycosyl hydrolases family 17 protein [Striga asiatica]
MLIALNFYRRLRSRVPRIVGEESEADRKESGAIYAFDKNLFTIPRRNWSHFLTNSFPKKSYQMEKASSTKRSEPNSSHLLCVKRKSKQHSIFMDGMSWKGFQRLYECFLLHLGIALSFRESYRCHPIPQKRRLRIPLLLVLQLLFLLILALLQMEPDGSGLIPMPKSVLSPPNHLRCWGNRQLERKKKKSVTAELEVTRGILLPGSFTSLRHLSICTTFSYDPVTGLGLGSSEEGWKVSLYGSEREELDGLTGERTSDSIEDGTPYGAEPVYSWSLSLSLSYGLEGNYHRALSSPIRGFGEAECFRFPIILVFFMGHWTPDSLSSKSIAWSRGRWFYGEVGGFRRESVLFLDGAGKGYNSAVECHLDVVEVISSSLIIPKPNIHGLHTRLNILGKQSNRGEQSETLKNEAKRSEERRGLGAKLRATLRVVLLMTELRFVRERVGGNEVGEVVGFCELFQPLLDVIPRAERE